MLRYLVVLVVSGASLACGFAGLGLALYAHGPALAAATLFGLVGFVSGLGCAVLQTAFVGRPAPQPAALPADELAALVRATLASVAQERADRSTRPGSAADRRPAAVQTSATASATATATASATAAATATATAPDTAAVVVAVGANRSPQRAPAEQARFASSAFGA